MAIRAHSGDQSAVRLLHRPGKAPLAPAPSSTEDFRRVQRPQPLAELLPETTWYAESPIMPPDAHGRARGGQRQVGSTASRKEGDVCRTGRVMNGIV